MAKPTPLQRGYAAGMKRDFARDALPPASAWNLVDYIPDLQAPLRKRGGWTYASPSLTSETSCDQLINAEFAAGTKLLAIGVGVGKLWEIVSASSATDRGAVGYAANRPIFHRDKVILPDSAGAATLKYWVPSAFTNITGPSGRHGAVYKDRSFLANSAANTNRVWYSSPGDPTTWDTTATGLWVDSSQAVTALASLRNVVLIYHSGTTERLRGTPQVDLTLEGLFDVGCADARSVATYQDQAVWADTKGVYLTDGAAIVDLTAAGGMKDYWLQLMAGTLPGQSSGAYTSSWKIAGGIFRNHYIVTVTTGSTFIDALVCDVARRRWWRDSNFIFKCFARVGSAAAEELYAGMITDGRVGAVSTTWNPTSAVSSDANATVVTPTFESPFYELGNQFVKTWRDVYLTSVCVDGGSVPTLTVAYTTDPNGTSYTSISPTIAASSTPHRVRLPLRFSARGVAFKVTQTNASSDTRLEDIESEAHLREGSR